MSDIYRVDTNLPNNDKISDLNEMIIYLNGLSSQGKFDKHELDHIYGLINVDRKYKRNVAIGNTIGTYSGWSHLKAEDGYSIWKFTPAEYKYNSLNNLYFDTKVLSNKGQADSESATTFNTVYTYNGATYTDNTTEAGTESGTEFSLMSATSHYLYVGLSTTFNGIKFEYQTRGSNYTLKVEYYNASSGDGWTQLTANDNTLDDDTNSFKSNGRITWASLSDWATTSVNSVSKYWIRISTTTTPVTTAKAYYIIPGNSVISLLALSSTEVLDEDWAWCSYNGSIYTTIRNAGNSTYEGDYYITSTSSTTNKQNFFVYNHPFTADYENNNYDAVKTISADSGIDTNDGILLVNAALGAVTLTLPSASSVDEGKSFTIKKIDSSNNVTVDCASGETIDGAATKVLSTQNSFVTVVSDGSVWYIISS